MFETCDQQTFAETIARQRPAQRHPAAAAVQANRSTLAPEPNRIAVAKQPRSRSTAPHSDKNAPGKRRLRTAHLLRKYDPIYWGGTETAVQRLLEGLNAAQVDSYVYAPRLERPGSDEPLSRSCLGVRRFQSVVPVAKLSIEQRRQLVALGGNLLSWELPWQLWKAPELDLIHSHTLGRLAGAARAVARLRRIPFVVTIHGGALDLPSAVFATLMKPLEGGWEWGKAFGALVRSRHVLKDADAILTVNPTEADLLRKQFPGKRILVQPHGVPAATYARDQRAAAHAFLPQLQGKDVLLCTGRLDPVKNQGWLVEQMPALLRHHPQAHLVLVGSCSDPDYSRQLTTKIQSLGIASAVTQAGGLPPNDPRLVGLFQSARLFLLPSLSETFGLVILEAWAAGTPVLSSRTSGAASLIKPNCTGWLFDLSDPAGFVAQANAILDTPSMAAEVTAAARRQIAAKFDTEALAAQVRDLYQTLIQEKQNR